VLEVDADHSADLFWGLCGGGPNFGVVTKVPLGQLAVCFAYQ
jgi:hypothetical protein